MYLTTQKLPAILHGSLAQQSEVMKILFRVDAGGKVGLGHFYRSITLARKLKEDGHKVVFSFIMSPFWSAQIQAGFDFLMLPLLEAKTEEETYLYIKSHCIDIYYVDAILDFSNEFLERLREICKVVFYQNMSAAAPCADIFIYPSLRSNPDFFSLFNNYSTIYRGLKYVIFHPDIFLMTRKEWFSGRLRNIAVSAGGSDPLNTLYHIYKIVKNKNFQAYQFTFFYGNDYIFKSNIPKNLPSNIKFQEFNHQEILLSNVLLTTFGVSTYEFLYLKMPVIAYGHQIDNAIASNELAMNTGALISLGEIEAVKQK